MTATLAEVKDWIHRFGAEVTENRQALVRLDTAIGDGDHGTNLERGMRKAVERVDGLEGDDIGAALKAVGMALVSSVGGAAGPLYGTLFMQMGQATAGQTELGLAEWSAALRSGLEGVQKRGKAERGEKTMVDALGPAVDALDAAAGEGLDLPEALARSAQAAHEGMQATKDMEARKGRASYLGSRSVGHQDPGATSTYLLLKTAAEALGAKET